MAKINPVKVKQDADKLEKAGKLPEAIALYKQVIEDNPRDWNIINKVGDLYAKLNKFKDAADYYAKVADFYAKDGFLHGGGPARLGDPVRLTLAEKAGLEEGNRIASINGVNLRSNKADLEDYENAGTLNRRLVRELEKVKPGDVSIGKFDIHATYTYAKAILDGWPAGDPE